MPPILCIVGRKAVGKTTLVVGLVAELKRRGYRVATVKRAPHHFEFDEPGKDSRRHFEAGADATLIYGDDKLALVRRNAAPPRLDDLVAELLPGHDLVVVEAHKTARLPKIEVFRSGAHPAPLYEGQPEYLAIASDERLELGLPWLDLNDPAAVAAFVAARFPKRSP